MSAAERWLFVDPPSRHFEQDRLFDGGLDNHGAIDLVTPYRHLRERLADARVKVHTADLIDSIPAAAGQEKLYISLGMRKRYPELARRPDVVLSALFALECPIVEPSLYADLHRAARVFRRVYSFSSEAALAPFLRGPVGLRPFRIPQFFDDVDDELWGRADRRFLTMINANKVPPLLLNELYSERVRALAYFARFGEIDLYGFGWDGPVLRVGDTRLPRPLRRFQHDIRRRLHDWRPPQDELSRAVRSAYRGPVQDKAATLAGYTFALCFENSVLEGWVTEKIFDCFYTGTIPVYLGAPDIERWVPPECFVDVREFEGYEQLRGYLRGLDAAAVRGYREAARDYVRSDGYRPFTRHAFADLIEGVVEEDAAAATRGTEIAIG